MTRFATIYGKAEARAGGADALAARLPSPLSSAELCALGDDRYLSLMSRRIFRAGLKHSLVDAKWPAFEEAFLRFDPKRVRALSEDQLDALMRDRRLIRHWGKIKAVCANAAEMGRIADAKGSVGAYLADWPACDIVGLWDELARRFAQMGGNSGPYFLRMAGKDTFLLTADVLRALERWAGLTIAPSSKRARREAGEAILRWAGEAARPLCQVSMILALSTGSD